MSHNHLIDVNEIEILQSLSEYVTIHATMRESAILLRRLLDSKQLMHLCRCGRKGHPLNYVAHVSSPPVLPYGSPLLDSTVLREPRR